MKSLLSFLSTSIFLLTFASGAHALTVTIVENATVNRVADDNHQSGASIEESHDATQIPHTERELTYINNSISISDIHHSVSNDETRISVEVDHRIDNTYGLFTPATCCDLAETFIDYTFTVDEDARYSLDGFYDMTGPAGTNVLFALQLVNETTSTTLFSEYSRSIDTMNESFIIDGVEEGDRTSGLAFGDMQGDLIAGVTYHLLGSLRIMAFTDTETTVVSTAIGEAGITITPIPVPMALWLFLSGGLGLLAAARSGN